MLKLPTRFLLTNVSKTVCGIFFILFRSWDICKNENGLVSTHSFFIFLLITKQNQKKSRARLFRNYYVENVCKISAKNIKLCGSWSSSKFSTFQTKKPGLLEIRDLWLNLVIGFCIIWLVLPNYNKISQ